MTAGRSYRTNVEILASLLHASRNPASKTKIMGAANVNPRSFEKYFHFCLEHDLVRSTSGGYVVTRWGSSVLETLEDVIARTAEIESAGHTLQGNGRGAPEASDSNGGALRHVSRWLWNDILVKSENGSSARRSDVLSQKGSRPVSDRGPFGAGALVPDGLDEEEGRTFETRTPRRNPPTEERGRRDVPSSRPGR